VPIIGPESSTAPSKSFNSTFKKLQQHQEASIAPSRSFNSTFKELQHRQSRADPCIQMHHSNLGYTITSTYTDDVAGGSSTHAAGVKVREDLGKAYEISNLGQPNKCLRMSIVVDDQMGDISLYQKTLILKILEIFEIEEAKPKYTPLPPNVN
jgi:hypothetical protein